MSVFLNLKWKGVTPPDADALDFAPEEFKLDRESAALPAPSSPLLPEIAVFGGDRSPKQIAIELLQAAAEIEHQFIVQYQYAYYCGGIQSQSPTPAVFRPLFIITKEEAGHMITVQNLLRLLGQPPHLARLDTLTPDPNDLRAQVEYGDSIGVDEIAAAVARPGSIVTKAEIMADPQQGLFLVAANGTATRIADLHDNLPGELLFSVPEGLAAGAYRLEVRTRYRSGSELKTASFGSTLTVA